MSWYIGQEIVCIKTHSQGVVKRGQIYTIKGLRNGICECSPVQIDVGIKAKAAFDTCNDCGVEVLTTSEIWWFHESLFAPLEYNQEAIDELLKEPILIER